MRDVIKYVNTRGDTVIFSEYPFCISEKALREFVNDFSDGVMVDAQDKNFTLPAALVATPEERNQYIAILDYDTANKTQGRLYINEWFIYCSFAGISSVVGKTNTAIRFDLDFVAPKAEFLREVKYNFLPVSASESGQNLPFNYPFNYAAKRTLVASINNTSAYDADYVIEFTGAVDEVVFSIDNTEFKVTAPILSDESFYLNTYTKNVFKSRNGQEVNLFGSADDENFIFSQMTTGKHVFSWEGEFSVNFTLLEHGRYPLWI